MQLIRYRFGDFVLDPAARELSRHGERVALPLKSLDCVVYLVEQRHRAVGRDELVSAVWGRVDVSDTVISQTLRRARKALDDAGDRQVMIRTVAGFGYRWVAEVETLEAASDDQATAPDDAPVLEPEPASGPEPVVLGAPASETAAVPPRARYLRWAVAVFVGLLLVTAAIIGTRHLQDRQTTAEIEANATRVTMLPVTVQGASAELSWVRLGAMEYAAERLRAARLQVTPTEQALHLEAVLLRDSSGGDSNLVALRDVLVRSDARWLIVPTARRAGTQWRVQLHAVGRSDELTVEASGDTPLQAMAVATDSWLERTGRQVPAQAAPTALQERLRRIDAELDAGQLDAAREQIQGAPAALRGSPILQVREGQLEYRAGHMSAATRLFEQALAKTGGDAPAVRAKGLMGLGAVALREGQFEQAQQHYSQALEVAAAAESAGDVGLSGNAYNGRGAAHAQLGQLDAAVSDLGHARMAMRRTGDAVSAAMVGSNLGRLEGMRNHWPQALQEFDSAIEVFRRYQVNDYLAATLTAKSSAELAVVQPAAAALTLAQTGRLLPGLEDARLLAVVRTTQVEVALANGQLAEADLLLKALPASSLSGQTDARLRMADAVARGDTAAAAKRAARLPDLAETVEPATLLVAAQAAGTRAAAQGWITRFEAQQPPDQRERQPELAWARALTQLRFGNGSAALQDADVALAIANRDGSPNDRVRANLLRARVLMDTGRLDDASAVLGELEAYAAVDYRVAWLAWTLYTRRGEAELANNAQQQVRALAGQRALKVVPLL